jgi:hypothetical protein
LADARAGGLDRKLPIERHYATEAPPPHLVERLEFELDPIQDGQRVRSRPSSSHSRKVWASGGSAIGKTPHRGDRQNY